MTIEIVKCKACHTEWRISIGPAMLTPLETVFPVRCDECAKETTMSLADFYNDRFCSCGGMWEFIASKKDRQCPKCKSKEYEVVSAMMMD